MNRRVVTFHYVLRDPSGQVLDSSAGGDPVTYLEGAGQIIDGLDEQLRAVATGTKTRVQVPAAKAYGERDAAQVQRVKRAVLPVDGEIKVGETFQTGEDRYAPVVTVVGIEGDEVLLDGNHPLAGVDLTFDVEVVGAREALAEELRHGHAHGADGCGGH
jgi:FKBP-type peptidyl-prolyl cis-trans isomerase SlyD